MLIQRNLIFVYLHKPLYLDTAIVFDGVETIEADKVAVCVFDWDELITTEGRPHLATKPIPSHTSIGLILVKLGVFDRPPVFCHHGLREQRPNYTLIDKAHFILALRVPYHLQHPPLGLVAGLSLEVGV